VIDPIAKETMMFSHSEFVVTIDQYGRGVGETPRMNGLVWSVHARPVAEAASRLGAFAIEASTKATRTQILDATGLNGAVDTDYWPRVDLHGVDGSVTGSKTLVAVANEAVAIVLDAATDQAGKSVAVSVVIYGAPI